MCPEWLDDFDQFARDMGPCPDGLTLDRIDNNKGYSKDNCRWATRKEQQNNRNYNRRIEHQGVTLTLVQWSERLGITRHCLQHRMDRGWTVERAFTQTMQRRLGRDEVIPQVA